MTRLVDGVFGETRFVLQEHVSRGYFPNARTAVIPGPVFPIPGRIPRRRQGALVVGYMGVLAPHKGVDVLARAAALLDDDRSMRFVVCGTGEDAAYVEYLQALFGHAAVEFQGWVQPALAYVQFDVLVVPSRWKEPFGRIVVEAMAYGIPVVCSDSGGIAESILDQVNGFIFPSGDAHTLARLLRDTIAADEPARLAMGYQALAHSRRFDLQDIAHHIDDFMQMTVAGRRVP
jgi:glycosyltransferase involved in cell wall biosynthesis